MEQVTQAVKFPSLEAGSTEQDAMPSNLIYLHSAPCFKRVARPDDLQLREDCYDLGLFSVICKGSFTSSIDFYTKFLALNGVLVLK